MPERTGQCVPATCRKRISSGTQRPEKEWPSSWPAALESSRSRRMERSCQFSWKWPRDECIVMQRVDSPHKEETRRPADHTCEGAQEASDALCVPLGRLVFSKQKRRAHNQHIRDESTQDANPGQCVNGFDSKHPGDKRHDRCRTDAADSSTDGYCVYLTWVSVIEECSLHKRKQTDGEAAEK